MKFWILDLLLKNRKIIVKPFEKLVDSEKPMSRSNFFKPINYVVS